MSASPTLTEQGEANEYLSELHRNDANKRSQCRNQQRDSAPDAVDESDGIC